MLVSLKFFSIFKNNFNLVDSNSVFDDSNLIFFVLINFFWLRCSSQMLSRAFFFCFTIFLESNWFWNRSNNIFDLFLTNYYFATLFMKIIQIFCCSNNVCTLLFIWLIIFSFISRVCVRDVVLNILYENKQKAKYYKYCVVKNIENNNNI